MPKTSCKVLIMMMMMMKTAKLWLAGPVAEMERSKARAGMKHEQGRSRSRNRAGAELILLLIRSNDVSKSTFCVKEPRASTYFC